MRPLAQSVIYQLFLRPFTPEGTLEGARRMLPHLKDTGADILYLCPICASDPDEDHAYWSDRTLTCGFGNPKNPYRLLDYYAIDTEYGTDDDLEAFVREAHALGLRVLLDLVYLHCGPRCALIREHPEYFILNEDGTPAHSQWRFPGFNFECRELWDYFAENMEHFIRRFDVDGYRCDCAGRIPAEFWQYVIGKARAVKPDIVMICEGHSVPHLEAGFDLDYGVTWIRDMEAFARGEGSARELVERLHEDALRCPPGKYGWHGLENHDFANDAWDRRVETVAGPALFECGLVINFTVEGIPYLYNGNEIADTNRHSILGNRFVAPHVGIRWNTALTPTGIARLALVKALCALRHEHGALTGGELSILPGPDKVAAYLRSDGTERICVLVNLSGEAQQADLPTVPAGEPLLVRGAGCDGTRVTLAPFGFLVTRCL